METIAFPRIVISFNVELEVEYNSFTGKTPEQFAESIQDDMNDVIMDSDRRILSVCSDIKTIETHE
jgi:hypothetical protein